MNNKNMPAMAQSIAVTESGDLHTVGEEFSGLTKREQAAIQIMAGFAASGRHDDYTVARAVKLTDALFDELEKD